MPNAIFISIFGFGLQKHKRHTSYQADGTTEYAGLLRLMRGACTKVRGRRLAHSRSHSTHHQKSIIEEEINPVD